MLILLGEDVCTNRGLEQLLHENINLSTTITKSKLKNLHNKKYHNIKLPLYVLEKKNQSQFTTNTCTFIIRYTLWEEGCEVV